MLDDHGLEGLLQAQLEELRRDVARLEERSIAMEMMIARIEGREDERDDRTRRTMEIRAARDRRELATKVVGGTVTVALAIVSAVVSILTAAKC